MFYQINDKIAINLSRIDSFAKSELPAKYVITFTVGVHNYFKTFSSAEERDDEFKHLLEVW